MLGSKKTASRRSGRTTLISEGTHVSGDIRFAGNLDVEGIVQGNITADTERGATLRIVGNGCVEGEIRAPNIVINGVVNGDVYCSKDLELAPKGRVNGDVYYAMVEMSAGAEVNGSLTHLSEATGNKGAEAASQTD